MVKSYLIGYLVPRKYAIVISVYIWVVSGPHKIPRKLLIGSPDLYSQFVYMIKLLVWTLLARTANFCLQLTLGNTSSVD